MKKIASVLFIGFLLLSGCDLKETQSIHSSSVSEKVTQIHHMVNKVSKPVSTNQATVSQPNQTGKYNVVVDFPEQRYPQTAQHIKDAFAKGESQVCTINRKGAKTNRGKSLEGIPNKPGYDRDEWPMAMCKEGGTGANIEYISPSDNRGAGSWVSHHLSQYPDGTRVKFEVQ